MTYKWYEKLKKLREDNGLTQMQLAQKIGVSRGTLANWELGRREPNADIFVKLAEMFNVSLDYLHDKPANAAEVKNFLHNIEAFFMSENINTEDKDAVIKDIMDLYFRGKNRRE